MVSIAVCDDEPSCLNTMGYLIQEYFRNRHENISLALYTDISRFLAEFAKNRYDIAILDIMMPKMTGIDASKLIYEQDQNCIIAFLTSSPDFAIQGYGVNAVTYVLKPTTNENVSLLLDKCMARFEKQGSQRLLVKSGHIQKKINPECITYLESRNKEVFIHYGREVLVCYGKLRDFIPRLPGCFVQIHKSYVVNLLHIDAMQRNAMITDTGQNLPISRQFHKLAVQRFFSHVEGKI